MLSSVVNYSILTNSYAEHSYSTTYACKHPANCLFPAHLPLTLPHVPTRLKFRPLTTSDSSRSTLQRQPVAPYRIIQHCNEVEVVTQCSMRWKFIGIVQRPRNCPQTWKLPPDMKNCLQTWKIVPRHAKLLQDMKNCSKTWKLPQDMKIAPRHEKLPQDMKNCPKTEKLPQYRKIATDRKINPRYKNCPKI